jgi:hypothetical protein
MGVHTCTASNLAWSITTNVLVLIDLCLGGGYGCVHVYCQQPGRVYHY